MSSPLARYARSRRVYRSSCRLCIQEYVVYMCTLYMSSSLARYARSRLVVMSSRILIVYIDVRRHYVHVCILKKFALARYARSRRVYMSSCRVCLHVYIIHIVVARSLRSLATCSHVVVYTHVYTYTAYMSSCLHVYTYCRLYGIHDVT